MRTSADGYTFIKGFEGRFLQAYDDKYDRIVRPGDIVHGTLTIGWGHTSDAGPPRVYVGQTITAPQADSILEADVASVEIEVDHLVKVKLTQNQFDALVSFQLNTGWLAHQHCSLLEALNAGNYKVADIDFMLYDRAQGKIVRGLDRRRHAEMALFAKP